LIPVLRATAQRWLVMPNVTSVGVGPELVRGTPTGRMSIQVTVKEKLTRNECTRERVEVLPTYVLDAAGRRAPVDVLQRTYRPAHELLPPPQPMPEVPPQTVSPKVQRRRRLARLRPGVSVGNAGGGAGTLGAIVFDRRTGAPCVLSNAHVLEGVTGQIGSEVLQPGARDDADVAANGVGRVVRSHIGLAGDCAIASIAGRLFDDGILELGVAPRQLAKAELGDLVVKSGRTTGVTHGRVVRVGVVVKHDYGGTIGVRDVGGFEVEPLMAGETVSDEGDSGALWMIEDATGVTDIAVGLHFALQADASAGTIHGLACNIHSVFEKLDITFTTLA